MPNKYKVSIVSKKDVHTLTGIWDADSLRCMLDLADADDIGEIADSDLLDIAVMVLQDLGNQKAGELVLEAVFGETMRPGVRQNLVDDLQENEPWSDFAEVDQQRGIFVAVCLLQQAFPNLYGTPDAVELGVNVKAGAAQDLAPLLELRPEWVVRLLSAGLDQHNILHRLYTDELVSGAFADAPGLIWQLQIGEVGDQGTSCNFTVIASTQLLGSLATGQEFSAAAGQL